MHGEFLNVRGQKMSKRYGNYTTPRDLREDGVDPGAIRLLFFQTHYRQKLDLTDEALAAAREGARRLGGFARRLQDAAGPGDESGRVRGTGRPARGRDSARRSTTTSTRPGRWRRLFDFVSEGNRLLDQGTRPGARGPRRLGAGRTACSMPPPRCVHHDRAAESCVAPGARGTVRHAAGSER